MRISERFIQELQDKIDIETVISSHVNLKRRGKTLVGLCPFHNEKTPSFTVYPESRSFYCFGCGAGGDAITFVRRIENLAGIQINQKIQQLSANLDKAKSDLEEAKANVAKPFGRADELAEKLKRLEYVNAQLSTDKNDDEPMPVSDIPTENEPVQAASVVVAMPVSAYTADKINPKPQTPPVPQNNIPKPVYNKMKR